MIFDAGTNVLISYLCSLQVYIQELCMHMCRLLGGTKHAKAKMKRLVNFQKTTALVSVVLVFEFSCSFEIKSGTKIFSVQLPWRNVY